MKINNWNQSQEATHSKNIIFASSSQFESQK